MSLASAGVHSRVMKLQRKGVGVVHDYHSVSVSKNQQCQVMKEQHSHEAKNFNCWRSAGSATKTWQWIHMRPPSLSRTLKWQVRKQARLSVNTRDF